MSFFSLIVFVNDEIDNFICHWQLFIQSIFFYRQILIKHIFFGSAFRKSDWTDFGNSIFRMIWSFSLKNRLCQMCLPMSSRYWEIMSIEMHYHEQIMDAIPWNYHAFIDQIMHENKLISGGFSNTLVAISSLFACNTLFSEKTNSLQLSNVKSFHTLSCIVFWEKTMDYKQIMMKWSLMHCKIQRSICFHALFDRQMHDNSWNTLHCHVMASIICSW